MADAGDSTKISPKFARPESRGYTRTTKRVKPEAGELGTAGVPWGLGDPQGGQAAQGGRTAKDEAGDARAP